MALNSEILEKRSIFNCISIEAPSSIKPQTFGFLDYMVTSIPRNYNTSTPFEYATIAIYEKQAFSINQSYILSVANKMFSSSKPLGGNESAVLQKTFYRLSQKSPSLPRRK